MLLDKILESDNIDREEFKKLLKMSKKTRKKDTTLTTFSNNSVMFKILDLFLDNEDLAIFTTDFLQTANISQKSFWSHMRILLALDIVIEIEIGKKKFYKWNEKNQQAKHISKLRDILNIKNVRTTTGTTPITITKTTPKEQE